MSVEEARAVWLLHLGSGWVSEIDVSMDNGLLWEAYTKLRLSDSLDKDRLFFMVRLK